MNSLAIAQRIKEYLVDLAINDKLPLDMTQLSLSELQNVIEENPNVNTEYSLHLAGNYLIETDDNTFESMVKAIVSHPNQNDLIDYIDGVMVWEKCENRFTCKDFLTTIEWK